MSRVFRICKQKHAATALDGEGARLAGGRWNSKGTRLVYTAGSVSLAALETLVHADIGLLLAADLVVVEVDVPDALAVRALTVASLPGHWRDVPAPAELAEIGEAWLRAGETACLRVPSAVVPQETNVLLNPVHPQAAAIRVVSTVRFDLDPRLRR